MKYEKQHELRCKIRNARKNANAQRRKEMDGRPVRVSSRFWQQVEADYRKELNAMYK